MNNIYRLLTWAAPLVLVLCLSNCSPPKGCTCAFSSNFDSSAKKDDGSCLGCMDFSADNYNECASIDDGSCLIPGCTNPDASNYDPDATKDDGSCIIAGCTDPGASNYNRSATEDDGSCLIPGCMDPDALNYDPDASTDDGSCVSKSTPGSVIFYTDEDYGCGIVTVTVKGHGSKSMTKYSSGGGSPDCWTDGFPTWTIPPDTYSYSAKCRDLSWSGSFTIESRTCLPFLLRESEASGGGTGGSSGSGSGSGTGGGSGGGTGGSPGGGSSSGTGGSSGSGSGGGSGGGTGGSSGSGSGSSSSSGSIVFYENANYGCGNSTTVTVSGHGSKSITQYRSNGYPDCGDDGFATWTLSPGSYSYNARCGDLRWSGDFTITQGTCLAFLLPNSSGTGGSSGSGSGGGSGGGSSGSGTGGSSGSGGGFGGNTGGGGSTGGSSGSSTGQIAFYIDRDHGCGNVRVTVNRYGSRTISQYFSNSTPNCGDNGTATWTLPPGSYSFNAGCRDLKWDGRFSIQRGTCQTYLLKGSSGGASGGSSGGGTGGSSGSGSGGGSGGNTGGGGNTTGSSGSSTGQVSFYMTQQCNCGNVSITVRGRGTKTLAYYLESTPDACGADGTVTWTLPPGTYYYSARSAQGGLTSEGNFEVTRNGCLAFQLYLN